MMKKMKLVDGSDSISDVFMIMIHERQMKRFHFSDDEKYIVLRKNRDNVFEKSAHIVSFGDPNKMKIWLDLNNMKRKKTGLHLFLKDFPTDEPVTIGTVWNIEDKA